MARILFSDLPYLHDLTREQLKELFGAGKFRLEVEALEGRLMMTATGNAMPVAVNVAGTTALAPALAAPIKMNAATKTLTLTGDNNANQAHVFIDTHNNSNPLDDQVVARINRDGQIFTQRFARAAVNKIVFQGNAGNDDFTNSTNIRAEAFGGDGDDRLYGGSAADLLMGESGNDYIHGGAGNDVILGGGGDDVIFGDDGRDNLDGGAGNDTIWDLSNNPREHRQWHQNTIDGSSGDDTIYAGLDNTIYGGDGNDDISGGGLIYGGSGNDTISGGAGNDEIYAEAGNDNVNGRAGQDQIYGGAGNDILHGGAGHDSVLGGDDNDNVYGDGSNDFVYGEGGDDFVMGGDGNDMVFGGDGRDYLDGGAGDDMLSGGRASFSASEGVRQRNDITDWNYDDLWGGAGRDTFWIADHKAPYWWLDTAVDADSGDTVKEVGIGGGIFTSLEWSGILPSSSFEGQSYYRWGHLYGT